MRVVHHFVEVGEAQGGVSRAILDLLDLFALVPAEDARTVLLTSEASDVPRARDDIGRGEVVFLDSPRAPFELYPRSSLRRVAETLEEADVLHLHGLWRPTASQVARLARRLGVPYVMSLHGMLDDWCMRQRAGLKRIYHRLLERRNLEAAAWVHATADAEARQASRWIPHDRIEVIPCALNLVPYRHPAPPQILAEVFPHVRLDRPIVLFLSRLHEKKGLDILIEAVALRREGGGQCQLLIAGTGEAREEHRLRELAARRLGSDAVFLGLVTGEAKSALLGHADLLALPTSQENFGLVIPEALACGTPVITTRGTDIWPELQAGRGTMVVDQTPDAFCRALGHLLDDEERLRRMGTEGKLWVLDWLDPHRIVGQYARMYSAAVLTGSQSTSC